MAKPGGEADSERNRAKPTPNGQRLRARADGRADGRAEEVRSVRHILILKWTKWTKK
jgi:hypothetical protein